MTPLDKIAYVPYEEDGSRITLKLDPIRTKDAPFVSVLTPTRNRAKFIQLMIRNWRVIDYPYTKREWIIVDDSNPGEELNWSMFKKECEHQGVIVNNIRYFRINKVLNLGEKRNFLARLARGEILVHFDDDDYYPAESVVARVKALRQNNKACTGCTSTLCYDILYDQTFESYDPVSSTDTRPCTISESTLAYTKTFWKERGFRDSDTHGECLAFIEDRHDQIILLPYVFVVTQLTHSTNTIERRVSKSTKHTSQFMDHIPMKDVLLLRSLKIEILKSIPIWKESIQFLQKHATEPKKTFVKKAFKTNPDILHNPFILHHLKTYRTKSTSSGKDIVYYCGPGKYLPFEREWDGETPGLGGSEEAVVHLAENWVRKGYNVTVYNTCRASKEINGVKYTEYWKWSPVDVQDVTIIWRDPSNLDNEIHSGKIVLDLHDVIDPSWLTPERVSNVTKIMFKSNFHLSITPDLPSDKVSVLPNGVDTIKFLKKRKVSRQPYKLMCTSSPDRCLEALLNALPMIQEVHPSVEIHWAYGFSSGITKQGMDENPYTKEWVQRMKRRIEETPGFFDLGRLSHSEIIRLTKSSNLFIYGTTFPEIDCISMTKAMVGGALPIVTACGALSEKVGFCKAYTDVQGPYVKSANVSSSLDHSVKGEAFRLWVKCIIQQLHHIPIDECERFKLSRKVCGIYDWKIVSSKWTDHF